MLALAEPPSPEAITRDLAHDLMSPYCPGRTVASCPSGQARKLEDEILEQAQQGRTREEIKADLIERFGEERLGSDRSPAVLYGTLVVLLLGAFAIFRFARQRLAARRRGAEATKWAEEHAAPEIRASRAELDELEDELDRVDDF